MAIESEITLSNQERGKAWEYRVIAANKASLCVGRRQAGEGAPSNTVMGML